MAQITVSADMLSGASQTKTKKGSDVFRLMVGDGQFLDINPVQYQRVVDGLIDGVEYDDQAKPLTMDDGTEVRFFKVNKTHASPVAAAAKAKAVIEAAKGFDMDEYEKAKKKLEGLVL